MIEYGCKLEEKLKAIKSEIQENVQEPTVNRGKPGLKSTVWTRKKKETFNQNRMKKQEFKKLRRGLGTSKTTLKVPTSES